MAVWQLGTRPRHVDPIGAWWVAGTPVPAQDRSVDAVLSGVPVDRLCQHLAGIYAAVRIASNRVEIAPDPAGYEMVYLGDAAGVAVASNRPELVAKVLGAAGAAVEPDVANACELAHLGFPLGPDTPYRGMRRMPPWSWCEVSERGVVVHPLPGDPPWRTTSDPVTEGDYATALDGARDAITNAVRASAALPTASRVVDVTGGRDSRLVVAAVHHIGAAHEFRHRTIGGAGLADVIRGRELCEHLGVDHEFGYPHPPPDDGGDEERLRRFVTATAGASNAFHLHSIQPSIDEVRLQGLGGELLRSGLLPRAVTLDLSAVPDAVMRLFRPDSTDFVRPPHRFTMHARAQSRLDLAPGRWADADDRVHDFYASVRFRGHVEQLSQLWPTENVLPLYSIPVLRLRSVGRATDRHPNTIYGDLLAATHRRAADVPFLDEQAAAPPPRTTPGTGTPTARSSLMAHLRAQRVDATAELFRHLAADATNPAWQVLDRSAVRDACDDLGALPNAVRRRLYGAFTAVVWLRNQR